MNAKKAGCDSRYGCIMGASMMAGSPPETWSDASKEVFESKIPIFGSLRDVPDKTMIFGAPVCGNGILEKDEECDCGNRKDCPCCDRDTCRLSEGNDLKGAFLHNFIYKNNHIENHM